MREPPISPDMSTHKPIPFTKDQLRAIWERIEKYNAHFEACCAFQKDGCHYEDDYNELYGFLILAGVESWKTPFDREAFESWLETYEEL